MNDMTAVIVPKSDQINADDLIPGPRTITITDVDIRPGTEQPVSIRFDGDNGKPWKPCKSMSRVLVAMWGPDAKKYVGRSVTLYRDPNVKWGGLPVGGIRISHMTDLPSEKLDNGKIQLALTETKGKRSPFVIRPLQVQAPALDIEAARQAIADAPTIEALRTVWSAKAMGSFRTQLQGELDARKAELSESPHAGTGELITQAEAMDQIQAQTTVADVNRLVGALEQGFDTAEQDQLRSVAAERCEQLLRAAE